MPIYNFILIFFQVILLLLVFVMRSRVSFLAALFKETAHCLGSIPALFLQPIITFFFLVLFLAFWSIVVVSFSFLFQSKFEIQLLTANNTSYRLFQVCLATANYPGIPFQTNFLLNGTSASELSQSNKIAIDAQNNSLKSKNKHLTKFGGQTRKLTTTYEF